MGRGGEDGMCRKASPGGQGQGSPQSRRPEGTLNPAKTAWADLTEDFF